MKIADVVNQLAKIIPQVTDFFSDTKEIVSISGNGSIVSVETATPHGLINGEFVNVRGVKVENPIIFINFNIVNGQSQLEITTVLDHDLTLNPRETKTQFVELVGFTDGVWNGNLELIERSNRKTFKVANGTASIPTLNTNELLLENIIRKFNGPQTATVLDATNFTYPSTLVVSGQNGSVQTNLRIAGLVNFERAMDQYTKQLENKFFMFVASPTVFANKVRGSQTDINDEQTQQSNFNANIRDGFIILVVANAANESGALKSLDNIRDEVFRAILLAVRGFKFPSGLACKSNQISNFISHGTFGYDNSLYMHQFIFEMPLVMTIADSIQSETLAFKDIDFVNSHPDNADAPELTASIDLDDDPIVSGISQVAGLVIQFDANDLSTIIEDGGLGSGVSRWIDKTGNGNDVTQSFIGAKPDTGVDTLNGRNVITFGPKILGEGTFLELSSFVGGVLSQPNTIFLVIKIEALFSEARTFFDGGSGSTRHRLGTIDNESLEAFSGNSINGSVLTINTPYILTVVFNSPNSKVFINGGLNVLGDTGNQDFNGLTLGGRFDTSDMYRGVIGEFLVYDRELSSPEIIFINEDLKSKWIP